MNKETHKSSRVCKVVPTGNLPSRPLAAHRPHPTPQTGPDAGRARPRPTGGPQKTECGRLVLTYLYECGFAPSQPVTYSWVRQGERKLMRYENPRGRRLNALAALGRTGPEPSLYWVAKPNKALKAEEFLRFLNALPRLPVLRVVVLDNGPFHPNDLARAALPDLWAKGIYLYCLPPYDPELNEIETVFQEVKHHDLPERTYNTIQALMCAVNDVFTLAETLVLSKCELKPRLAA